ncbi:MAG: PadR family transcriptional regulator [Burkholderiaceae bacterium]|nr:PadR family transcriptional regulator [Roseateles sp.]MBV8471438.1 PadR family transcriptional regulator [Burkholderiaceae bacterium]
MSLAHAVLTSLIEKSCSGYDLARRFDKSIGYFWQASHQQIYRELARMEAAGWIQSSLAPDAGKTRKRIYEVLPAGRKELKRWTRQPSSPVDLRDELGVRLRADAALGPQGLEDELRERIHVHEEKLRVYREIDARDFPDSKALSRKARIHRMILQRGIQFEEHSLAWTRQMLEALEQGPG